MGFHKPHSFAQLNLGHSNARDLLHAWIPNGNQSGNIHDLVGPTDLSPSAGFGTPTIAGHRHLFDGGTSGNSTATVPEIGPPFTVLVLAERDDTAATEMAFLGHETGGANDGYHLWSTLDSLRFTLGGVANYNTFSSVVSAGEPFLYAVRMDVDGGDIVAYFQVLGDGNPILTNSIDVGSIAGLGGLTHVGLGVQRLTRKDLTGSMYAALWWGREVFDEEMAGLFHDLYEAWRTTSKLYLFGGAPPTPTQTFTPTPTQTFTPTPTQTFTPTPTQTFTPTPTQTFTPTPTQTFTPTPTQTFTPTPTQTFTPTPTQTFTPTPTQTFTPTPTPTQTFTPTPTPTQTFTPTPTPTQTFTPTPSPSPSPSPTPTETATPTPTPTPAGDPIILLQVHAPPLLEVAAFREPLRVGTGL